MKMAYLISYDIKDDRRLQRIHRYLRGKGIHLQKSVFYILSETEGLKTIIDGLNGIIDKLQDDVRIYPLLNDFNAIVMGKGDKLPGEVWIYLD